MSPEAEAAVCQYGAPPVIWRGSATVGSADIEGPVNFSRLPRPQPTPETAHFWEGTKRGELLLQRCGHCEHVYFPPRPFCPACASRDVEVFAASGKARLYSYVINYRPHRAFDGPYSIAVVELAEGPRLMTNVINVEQTPEALELDMALEVTFRALDDEITLPYFQPAVSLS